MKNISIAFGAFLLCSNGLFANELELNNFTTDLSFNMNESASSGGGGWYITPQVGVNYITNTSTEGYTVEYDAGVSFGIGFGTQLQSDLDFRFDIGYVRNDIDTITNESTNLSAAPDVEFTQIPFMFNLIWSPANQPDLQPYFGLGLGLVRGEYEANQFISSDTEWAFAGQLMAGVKVEFSSSSALWIGYNFRLAKYDDTIDNHTVGVGFQFKF